MIIAAALACTWPLFLTKRRSLSTVPSNRLVEIKTPTHPQKALICFAGSATNAYLDETYSNGEGSDTWCSTHQIIPKDIFTGYADPPCTALSCFLVDLANYNLYSNTWQGVIACSANYTSVTPFNVHFICG
jgi:hypothetical protein